MAIDPATLTMIGGTALGAIQGIGAGKRQVRQQEKLQRLQIKGQKEMMDYQQKSALDMWNKTNYGAQVEHLKAAGLNPGLIYGMSGGGGATTGNPSGSVQGATAEQPHQTAATGMGMAMMAAQLKVLESQADKNNADAEAKRGVETQEGEARIADITQGIENKKAAEELTRVQTKLNEIQTKIANETANDQIERIAWETEKAFNDFQNIATENYINQATKETKIEIIKQAGVEAILRNVLTRANIQNTKTDTQLKEEQITKTVQEIAQRWKQLELETRSLDQKDKDIKIKQFSEEIKANYPSLLNTIGRVFDDGLDKIMELGNKVRPQTKGVK